MFFVDSGKPNASAEAPSFNFDYGDLKTGSGNSDNDDDNDDEGDHQAPSSSSSNQAPPAPPSLKSKMKKAAWVDPDDATLSVSLATNNRLRKLRDAPTEDKVGGAQYEARLRRQFERINPAPEWAAKARKKQSEKKRRRESGDVVELELDDADEAKRVNNDDDVDDGEGLEDLFSRTDGIVSKKSTRILEKGTIGVERLRDANQSAKSEGEIKALSFHPSPRVPVLMTASSDRRVRLYNVTSLSSNYLAQS